MKPTPAGVIYRMSGRRDRPDKREAAEAAKIAAAAALALRGARPGEAFYRQKTTPAHRLRYSLCAGVAVFLGFLFARRICVMRQLPRLDVGLLSSIEKRVSMRSAARSPLFWVEKNHALLAWNLDYLKSQLLFRYITVIVTVNKVVDIGFFRLWLVNANLQNRINKTSSFLLLSL